MLERAIPVEAEFTLLKKNIKGGRVRLGARYRCALATLGRLVFTETGSISEVWIHNLSKKGIGLNLDRPIDVQTPVVVHLKNSFTSFRLGARVIHATPQADGTWRIGCELLDELTPEMLDDLLQEST
jgi:hypothetical protein